MQFFLEKWASAAAKFALIAGLAVTIFISQSSLFAQSTTTGSINGTVVDSTGAVVANATVTVTDTTTGAAHTYTTNSHGLFTAPFLPPNVFDVSATSPGLQSTTTSVQILNGQQSAVTVTVTPSANTTVVKVSAMNAQLIDTQTSNTTTTFTTAQFQNLPAPGGDITTIAFTVPGVVVGAGTEGFGEIVSNGLPGLSNMVIVNGTDYNISQYGGVNFSGSSNLTLGQQEIAQAAVVQNGYSVQYGRQAGIVETYATKSGANRVHGLLQYNYNSSGLNANDFFNNLNGVPKSKAVSNQYAAQIGGPIKRDKLFFFADTEGIRFILPQTGFVNLPSPALQASVLANPNLSAASKTLYGTMLTSTNASPAYASAVPVTTGNGSLQDSSGRYGCGSLAGTPDYATGGTLGTSAGESCIDSAFINAAGLNKEYLIAGRVDWNVSPKHLVFFRVTDDQGQQPTFTSLINPLWNAGSTQPSYTGQMNDTYTFSPNVVNQFIVGALYYSSIFGPPNIPAALAASPTEFNQSSDGGTNSLAGVGQFSFFSAGTTLGAIWDDFPGGTNGTQYQVVDALSWLKGNHNFKFGVDFVHYDLTDVVLQTAAFGGFYTFGQIADEFAGSLPGPSQSSTFTQGFPRAGLGNLYDAVYNLGLYAQDDWRVKPNLVLNYGIRFDRNGNPACVNNCYNYYAGGFPASFPSGTDPLTVPYNATITTGHRSAFPSIEPVVVQPRVGFNWDMRGDGKTVIRGGVGLFSDNFPGLILEQAQSGFPNRYFAGVGTGTVAQGPGSAQAVAAGSADAVLNGFSQGATYNQINATVLAETGFPFSPPNYSTTPNEFHSSRYLEYSLQLQRQITQTDAVILSYAGNHGFNLFMPVDNFNQSVGTTPYGSYGNGTFDNVPINSADPRFATVQGFTSNAISNYNGLSVEYKHFDRRGLTTDISYTYAHALDDISNGGNSQLPYNSASVAFQITPTGPSRLMYSNADYDIRHNFVMDLVYVEPYHFGNKIVDFGAAGWTVGAKAYWRSGQPFSVFNVDAGNALGANATGGTTVLAEVMNNNFNHHCTSFSNPCFQTAGIFNGAGPQDAGPGVVVQTNYGNVPRNAFYGPHYADVDVNLFKDVFKKGSMAFQVGAQAYNVLNHVNFGPPGNNASNPSTLGVISSDIGPPTSPYGSSQSPSVVSGRVLVVQGRLVF
jgi:hypothetical protein